MAFPNVRLASRPLHFIYVCDCSGSMEAQGKIESLNQAIRQSLPGMAAVARDNPEARVLVRVVRFADRAAWHISTPTPVEDLEWVDLQAGGVTAMGEALELLAAELRSPPMEQRALPPVLVLISDGQPTDDFDTGLSMLMRQPWAQKAVRLAIAMGHDADLEILQQFIGPEPRGSGGRSPRRPLQASNATRPTADSASPAVDAIQNPRAPCQASGTAPPMLNASRLPPPRPTPHSAST
jgi:uncharacterized protein YegL